MHQVDPLLTGGELEQSGADPERLHPGRDGPTEIVVGEHGGQSDPGAGRGRGGSDVEGVTRDPQHSRDIVSEGHGGGHLDEHLAETDHVVAVSCHGGHQSWIEPSRRRFTGRYFGS